MRRIYGERREAMLEALERHLEHRLEVLPSVSGLHIACIPKGSKLGGSLTARTRAGGVRLQTLDGFTGSATLKRHHLRAGSHSDATHSSTDTQAGVGHAAGGEGHMPR
jgi:DNA-binding transcriptional MocR family regulator